MNTIDYLLLAVLAGGALYTFYRLFLGYVASRTRQVEVVDGTDYPSLSRADNTRAALNRHSANASATRIPKSNREHSNI